MSACVIVVARRGNYERFLSSLRCLNRLSHDAVDR
jgi:hypothetical protein